MIFLKALACLLIASLAGELYFSSTIDNRGGWDFGILPYIAGYLIIFVPAVPFWILLFLPTFALLSAKSLFWRIYVAPIVGGLIAYLLGVAFGLAQGLTSSHMEKGLQTDPGLLMTITVTGFTLFTCGAICKQVERL